MTALLFLRTSASRLLVPVGTMAAVAQLLFDDAWQGSWGESTLRATTHLVFLLPFIMVAAAVDGRRLLGGTIQPAAATTVRPGATALAAVAAPAAWGVAGYGVVLASAFAATARVNPLAAPPIPMWWILPAIAAVVAHAAVGALLGRVLSPMIAVAAALTLAFLGNAVLASYQARIPALFTVADDAFLGAGFVPRWSVQLAQTMFFLAVGALAIAIGAALVRPGRRPALAATFAAGAVVATVFGLVGGGADKRQVLTDATGPRVCSASTCLWADHAHLLDAYSSVGGRMLADAPTAFAVTGWTEAGLARPQGHAVLEVTATRPTADNVALGLADGLLDSVVGPSGAATSGRTTARTWLIARVLPEPEASRFADLYAPEVVEVRGRPIAEQWAWFLRSAG